MINANTPREKVLELGMHCSRKNNCCKHGSGFLAKGDLEKISGLLKMSEEEVRGKFVVEKEFFHRRLLRPRIKGDKPYGECIFFDGKGCKIHEAKPMQCRVGNCSKEGEELSAWFLVNEILDKDDPQSIREYASYVKSGGKVIPGASLEEIVPDKDKLKKILNYEVLR